MATRPPPTSRPSLVHWLAGDDAAAIAAAERVASTEGSTYLDRAIAAVSEAGARARLGEHADAVAVLDRALTEVIAVGDVVATALLRAAHRRLAGVDHASGVADETVLGPGWRQIVAALPAVEPAA